MRVQRQLEVLVEEHVLGFFLDEEFERELCDREIRPNRETDASLLGLVRFDHPKPDHTRSDFQALAGRIGDLNPRVWRGGFPNVPERQQEVHRFTFLNASIAVSYRMTRSVVDDLKVVGKPWTSGALQHDDAPERSRDKPVVLLKLNFHRQLARRLSPRDLNGDSGLGAASRIDFAEVKHVAVEERVITLGFALEPVQRTLARILHRQE